MNRSRTIVAKISGDRCPERGCVVLDQPQHISKTWGFRIFHALRLVCEKAALLSATLTTTSLLLLCPASARAQGGVRVVDLDLAGAPLLVVWRAGTTSALDRESIAGSRDVGAAAAFSRRLGGRVLAFTAGAGQVRDQQTGSVWDPFGRATAGPLAGSRLTPASATDSFWFDWAAFHPDTAVWTG